jgi:hypothetical protein
MEESVSLERSGTLRRMGDGQHLVQQAFQRHGVAADSAKVEKFAIALPMAMFEPDLVVVIVAAERNGKLLKVEAVGFLCVPLGFFNFSDHSIIHSRLLEKKRHASAMPRAWCVSCKLSKITAHGGFPPNGKMSKV